MNDRGAEDASLCMQQRLTGNEQQVLWLQQLDVHPAEPIEEGLRQPFAAPTLLEGVLGSKQVKGAGTLEGLSQLRNEHFSTVVKHSIQALQYALPC